MYEKAYTAVTTSRSLRVVVADDEPLARERICDILSEDAAFGIVAECRDGLEVVTAVTELRPDVLLLDIQMPRLSGLEAMRIIGADRMPVTIFITAFGDFAVEAFNLCALDYLMKPYEQERLKRALARARDVVGAQPRGYADELRGLLAQLGGGHSYTERFLVKKGTDYIFIKASEVDWIQSADNYVTLHCGVQRYMIRDTISSVEARLDPKRFLRVRASAIVNLEKVASIRPWSGTQFSFILQQGQEVLSSRRFRDRIRTLIP